MKTYVRLLSLCALSLLFIGQGCVSFGSSSSNSSGPAGMFASSNKGESWQPVSTLPKSDGIKNMSGVSVYRIFDDPQDPSTMYWASRGHGLFFTHDNGITWQQPLSPSLTQGFIYGVAVHPKDKCTLYVTNGKLVYKSTDCTRTWSEVHRESSSDNVVSVLISPVAPYDVYLATTKGRFLVSKDTGVSWQTVFQFRYPIAEAFVDPFVKDRVYVATKEYGMYRSFDAGQTWVSANEDIADLSDALEFRRFIPYTGKEHYLYYVSTYGIHVSENAGDSWETLELIHPAGSAKIYGFDVNPQNKNEIYYTATINDRSTFYKSIDGGVSWITKELPSKQLPTALRVHPSIDNQLYLGFTIPPKE
ncbi:hypothetical protein KKG22_02985 [Patescibacteria group bacterium]|nr:hypothetical protein [Patescibacteria group bacterium]MBU1721453.1 hypothetical protein [Patescibacteria group bacterium]MBU1900790.1 hypothetical protein [Patescibacteria group bacterium]